MQEGLDNNDFSVYSKHNEVKSVIAKRFRRTLKDKILKKTMAADNRKSYLANLNKLVD